MANLYKDADKRRRVVPGSGAATETPKAVEPEKKEFVEETKPIVAATEPAVEETVQLPIDDFKVFEKAKKKTVSLYLSEAVMEELTKRSKKAKTNPSLYLDEMLKRAFGI